ncbi:uncharacterized protein FPRO_07325 [Fusarium proliferatum ET1]|uniref:Uncharacterized protein n=1 Tax=Fusarium proliferatum (strain ET1) TaxID=1227346 RepID=A0A1L7VTL0_FUSPR|nr:uncharacterized protein FPRO_07325 [Fusarium proliferatum ET1]CZR43758.1 uncharacterized protein FPRO_07325 [Fusarium proliferatum ET1]
MRLIRLRPATVGALCLKACACIMHIEAIRGGDAAISIERCSQSDVGQAAISPRIHFRSLKVSLPVYTKTDTKHKLLLNS